MGSPAVYPWVVTFGWCSTWQGLVGKPAVYVNDQMGVGTVGGGALVCRNFTPHRGGAALGGKLPCSALKLRPSEPPQASGG